MKYTLYFSSASWGQSVVSQKRKKNPLLFPLSDTFSSVLHSYSPVVKDSQMQNNDTNHAGKFPNSETQYTNQQLQWISSEMKVVEAYYCEISSPIGFLFV